MIKSQHSRLFEQLLAEERAKLVSSILEGLSPDWYRTTVGQVQGLDAALKLSEEADRKLIGEE